MQSKFHATTNINAEEGEERYGSLVLSRMRELFNWLSMVKQKDDLAPIYAHITVDENRAEIILKRSIFVN